MAGDFNRRWYDYTGTRLEAMQGWGWTVVHDPSLLPTVMERWPLDRRRRTIRDGIPDSWCHGDFRWFLTRVNPLRDAEGRIVRWFGSNTNIDERRRNEDFRETFLGILGHDLRNPLNTVLTTSRVLEMRPDMPQEIRNRLHRMTSSGVRMRTIGGKARGDDRVALRSTT